MNKFLRLPYIEGISDFINRDIRLVNGMLAIAELYSKNKSFAVAKAMNVVVLTNIKNKIIEFMRDGGTMKEFREWFVKQGGITDASRAYADTVIRTNLSTAYNAGRYRQAELSNEVIGFEYLATGGSAGDGSTRPNHAAVDGLRAYKDDAIWEHVFPPLGYNCRCSIRIITALEAKRNGWIGENIDKFTYHPKIGSVGITENSLKTIGAYPDSKDWGKSPKKKI